MDDIKVISRALAGAEKTVLIGFPGSGLVGSIALQYLVEQMDFEQIGTITSKYFPPVALMTKGVINAPVRLYEKDNLAAVISDVPIHPMICYEVANGIMDWLTRFDIKEITTIAGIITNEPEKRVFGVATTREILQRLEEETIILPMGSLSGIAASILTECKTRGIPGLGLLGETVNTPDPRSSAATIEVLNKIYNISLDINPLLEQAVEIEAAMAQISEQVQKTEATPRREQLPMYG
ncbi:MULTISPECIES: proteasome assembly chaperone family protein [unclassified Methanoculleus]|uniref:proteasome assembly chaperone family protein n=1 Tax=unclassified Methanoculleus TaxID=2619537 RepID=UPI0025F59B6D|nr:MULTISPECIES: proteasome assembly chaperone family protein [unclassified Methanoculleus]MCK9318315.1 proteasome assembly chaperone family protein [Methanoculleus sp.]MDD2253853.1 proteasome assembly chaperone family protein [Methanoculleus sp.]MDD2786537.1 proteasome assembly chaperone family protein [Methanoculleus sp.]MDD3215614.1 proteasome assembly chaperone family protein [Methanoculleus sp.]MDD4313466.1 proteasome assembly chaperone family protein [Methanoculleus sp.]